MSARPPAPRRHPDREWPPRGVCLAAESARSILRPLTSKPLRRVPVRFAIALAFCLWVAASGVHAAVGFHAAKGHVSHRTDDRLPSLWNRTAEGRQASSLLTPVLLAQTDQQTQASVYTLADGYTEGKILAEDLSTGGHFLGGFACGFLSGLIGTGILWGVTGGDDVPLHLNPDIEGKGSDYSMGFLRGYKERTKQKKRGARLGGGLLGTAGFVLVYLSATS